MTEPVAETQTRKLFLKFCQLVESKLTFKLGEAARVAGWAVQEVEVLVALVVLAAGLQVVGGETLPEGVDVLRLALVWGTDVTLETGD